MNIVIPLYFRSLLPLTCLTVGFAMPGQPAAHAAPNPWEAPGTYQVETVKYDWHDAKRDRKVPVKIYYPKDAKDKSPVIIFSHGLGGSRDGYEYLGRYWASHGYISVHLDHLGSDASVWQGLRFDEIKPALKRAAMTPQNIVNRPLDVSFAIDQLEKMAKDDPLLKDRLDFARIGVAGHSFGGFTTLAIAGEVFVLPGGEQRSWVDPRVKAAVTMSAPAPENRSQLDTAFAQIKIPILHMTGTLDDSPIGETKAADRRIPYDHIKHAKQYLVIFNGGDHMIFSGHPSGKNSPHAETDAVFQRLICQGTTAFWDGYLKDDPAAVSWVKNGGYKTVLGDNATFGKK